MSREWTVGEVIEGRWEVRRVLRGGMGVVYIVYDREWKQAMAAKTYQAGASPQLFVAEALAWIRLDEHPNVTRALFGQDIGGQPVLFLEYVSGGDLSRWIGTPALMQDPERILRWALEFCDGMTHARAKGVAVHRDVKPHNCLITEDGQLKITDFGLVKAGAGAGTPAYMAPEQFVAGAAVDGRADIYSFGVMLHQMVTGRLPAAGGAELPAGIREVVARCLAQRPEQRWPDFVALRASMAALYFSVAKRPAPEPAVGRAPDGLQWNNKGVGLSAIGEWAEALAAYERALEMDRGLSRTWHNRGSALSSLGRREEALESYAEALRLEPGMQRAWGAKGNLLRMMGRHEEALACLDRAGSALEFRMARAEALAGLGRLEEAWAAYGELDDSSALVWTGRGNLRRQMGEAEDAVRCFRRVLEISPGEEAVRKELALVLHNWGVRERAAGHVERALELAEEALREDGGLTEAWLAKGNALADLERVEESLAAFDRLLEIDPKHGEGWLNKGATLGNEGRMEEARACFERAAELGVERARGMAARCGPEEPKLTVDQWLVFASGSREDGRREDALRLYEEGVREHPRSADLWYAMGGLLEELGREKDAVGAYERVVAIDPDRSTAWLFLGELLVKDPERAEEGEDYRVRGKNAIDGGRLFREGKFEEALQCYLVALQKGHEAARGRVADCLGAIAAGQRKTAEEWFGEGQQMVVEGGRAAEALDCFERAIGMDAEYMRAWWGKALMLADLGREAEARAAFGACERLAPENAELRVSRAAWHYQSKRFEEAMAGYQEARELGHVQAWQGVVLCREALGLDPFTGR